MSYESSHTDRHTVLCSTAMLGLCALLALPGCRDQLLPVESTTPTTTSAKVVFTEINDSLEHNNGAIVARVDPDGSARVSLADGTMHATPGAAGVLYQRGDQSLWLLPYTGSAAGTPLMLVGPPDVPASSNVIDPYTVALSPNGTLLTYTIYNNRTTVITRIGGSEPVTLPLGVSHETLPSFSPDGSRLAFFHADSGWAGSPGSVYIVNADGTGLRHIETLDRVQHEGYSSIDWSPSGDRIVYTRRMNTGADIRIIGVDGSGARTVGQGLFPIWNPAGDSILFTNLDNSSDLYMVSADGSGIARQIVATPTVLEIFPRFSPDGKKLVYTSHAGQIDKTLGRLTVLDLATGTTKVVSESAYKGFWVK